MLCLAPLLSDYKSTRFPVLKCLLCSVILFNPACAHVLLPQVSVVSALAQLASLQTLYLDGTGVREGSLENLATHSSLSSLSLAGIPVADGNHALQIISGETLCF